MTAQTKRSGLNLMLLATAILLVSSCTKTRNATLPDDQQENVIAISEFGTLDTNSTFTIQASQNAQELSNVSSASALNEKQVFKIDEDVMQIPNRLRFMFKDLSITSQNAEKIKIVFAVDSKNVTAYKLVADSVQLTAIEKQLALSIDEVKNAVATQRSSGQIQKLAEVQKQMTAARTERLKAIQLNKAQNLLIPLFKYEIQAKGILRRTKNELKEETSTLELKETEFSQATHIKLSGKSDDRKEIGAVDQLKELSQLFTASKIDNKIFSQQNLAETLNIELAGKFKSKDSEILTRLDAKDLKLFEIMKSDDLQQDQLRIFKSSGSNSEIMTCAEAKVVSTTIKENCVVVLRAHVPISYKAAKLTLVSSNGSTGHQIELEDVSKDQSLGLIYIAKKSVVENVQSTGVIDPQNTFKISDLSGDFFYRRTVEDASNSFMGDVGTSGDTYVAQFELSDKRLTVRSTETLAKYFGQGKQDREELMSFEANYFKMERLDTSGSKLTVPVLKKVSLKEAEYVQINLLNNSIPDSSSPMAFYQFGKCLVQTGNQEISDSKIDFSRGVFNFSIQSSLTVRPECSATLELNSFNFWGNPTQFNFTVRERISFRKKTDTAVDEVLGNVSPQVQSALNYNGLTLAEVNTTSPNSFDLRKNDSQTYKIAQHDFRNGKQLIYHVGGLETADPSRKEILKKVALDVAKDWNEAFRRAFKGTTLERSQDYVVISFDNEKDKGNLGDLDRSYIWFFDLPFENGALGVAQPAMNPRSGQIISSNVLMYPGNMSNQLKQFYKSTRKQREYEILLEEIKKEKTAELLAKWSELEKQAEEEATKQEVSQQQAQQQVMGKNENSSTPGQAQPKLKSFSKPSFLQKVLVKNRFSKPILMTSKFDALKAKYLANKKAQIKTNLSKKVFNKLVDSNKMNFSKRVIEKIFKEDIEKDPLVMEAIIAQEFLTSDSTLQPEAKLLLKNKIQLNQLKQNFNKNFKARFGCKIESDAIELGAVNDSFLNKSFDESFEGIMKWVLAHEMGHAFGLIHNFKGSFDKENYAFEGEKTDRTYSSVMDYIAYSEAPYRGLGTYDVHAIRAIYTQQIEISKIYQSEANLTTYLEKITTEGKLDAAAVAKATAVLKQRYAKLHATTLNDGKYIQISDALTALGFPNESYITKQTVAKTDLFRFFHQCNDGEKVSDIRCTPYDWGSSAEEIVKSMVRQYERSYASAYFAGDRIAFGWSQKVALIRRTLSDFREIRAFLDTTIEMLMGKARNQNEVADFAAASMEGYRFFNNLIRIPDTDLGLADTSNKEAFKKNLSDRLYPLLSEKPIFKKDQAGQLELDENGAPIVESTVKQISFIEARRVYDKRISSDKIDTIGIGFDKSFALEFLLLSSPTGLGDDSQMGYISYLDFEKMASQNDTAPSESFVIKSISSILSGQLSVGQFTSDSQFVSTDNPATVNITSAVTAAISANATPRLPVINMNRFLLDGAIDGSILSLNETKQRGFDAFAEHFKIGRSEGGLTLKDRVSVRRSMVNANSQSAVRFWAADNASGAEDLINAAALTEKMLDNNDELAKGLAATMLYINDVAVLSQDSSKTVELEAAKKKAKDAADSLVKLMVEKLNSDGLFSNIPDTTPEKIMMQLAQELTERAQSLYSGLKKFTLAINSKKLTAAQITATLQAQSALKSKLANQVDKDPTDSISQKAAIELLEADKLSLVASDEKEEIPAAQAYAADIVAPDAILKENIDAKLGIIEDINLRTMLISPEFKR